MPVVSFPMPFHSVTATFVPPTFGTADAYGNRLPVYDPTNKVETPCCYALDDTNDAIVDGRPHADELSLRLYLPKTFSTDIRGAHVTLATGDPIVDALTFKVEGVPVSYDRAATPGDYSWFVRVVEFLG